MSSQPITLPSTDAIKTYLQNWPTNASNAMKGTFASLSLRDYIRLVWIVGGYVFLRPHLEKAFKFLFDRGQKRREAAEDEEDEEGEESVQAKISANELRGISSATTTGAEVDEEEEKTPVPQWGRAARLRQKKAMQLIEEEFARRKEEEDDKDIADLLED